MRAKFWQNNSWVCMSLWWADTNAGVKLVKMMNDPSEGRAGKTEWDPCWGGFPLAVVGLFHWRFGMMGVEMGFGWIQVTVSCSHLSYKFLHRNKSAYLNSAGSKQHGEALLMPVFYRGSGTQQQQTPCKSSFWNAHLTAYDEFQV